MQNTVAIELDKFEFRVKNTIETFEDIKHLTFLQHW